MKTKPRRAFSHGTVAALAAIALAWGCSSGNPTPGFGDPDDAGGDDSGGSYGGGSSSSSGGPDGGTSSGGAHEASGNEAGGGTKSAPCHGVPASCSSAASETACTTLGCTWGGMCTGSALPCPGLSESKCGIQQNCTYDSVTLQCSGTAYACSVLAAAYGCTTQQGCSWQMGCSGVASLSCSSLGNSTSCLQAGCLWN